MFGWSGCELADLPKVTVGICKEAANLATPVVGRSHKLGTPPLECLVAGLTGFDTNRERVAGPSRIWWQEYDIRLVRCWISSLDQKKPDPR